MRLYRIGLAAALALVLASPAAAEPPDDCGLEPPELALKAPPVPHKPREVAGLGESGLPLVRRMAPPGTRRYGTVGRARTGALSGKTVYVSAGHGFTWVDSLSSWHTQRGNTHDIVEDLVSTEVVSHYLVHYLRNMGAYVVTVREADWSWEMSLVDDASAGFGVEGGLTMADGPTGYGVVATPITDQTNPFASGGSRVFDAVAQPSGAAVWTFDVPKSGAYNVYVGWVQDPSRASDAHYVVRHAGGDTEFRVDQRRHGGTWVLLGRFWFEAGMSPEHGSVALMNDSADDGATLSADVARIGGGMGVIDRGGGVSGRPMFENCSRYYAQLAGAPPTVYDYASTDGKDDVGTRSRFTAWDHEDGEDAVYIAWHTNAPSPARGTSSFVYGPSSYGPLSEFTGTPGSLQLVGFVHDELVNDFRQDYQADWQDRGQHSAYFGEVNPANNPETPAALFEIAFHDTLEDADALRDPYFRNIAARAMAEGVARYFADADGTTLVLPPEPPTAPRAVAEDGAIRFSWDPPAADPAGGDPADGYIVYLSRDGNAFDDGTAVSGNELVVDAPADGGAVYARITATNAGGESMASRVVGARTGAAGTAQVLVVAAYDRLDGGMLLREDLSAYDLATVDRGLIERINDGSHVARYGAAIDAAKVSFDSADGAAVAAGEVDLSGYAMVIWQLGRDVAVPSSEVRVALGDYTAAGGKLVVFGTDLVTALAGDGSPEAATFLSDVLHVDAAADDAATFGLSAEAGELFDGLAPLSFDDDGPGGYRALSPDALMPASGGGAALRYDGGDVAAAVWRDADQALGTLVAGFPFETISGADRRAEVMARILAGFEIPPDPLGGDGGGGNGGNDVAGGCCDGGGGSGLPGAAALALLVLAAVVRRQRAA